MIESALEYIKKQGFSTALLVAIAWILYNKIENLEKRIYDCEADKFAIIVANNERSNEVILQNTEAFERNTEVLEQIKTFVGMGPTIHRKKSPVTGRGGISGFPTNK